MGDLNDDREFGLDGHPDGNLPGGGVAASGQVTMKKVPYDQDADEDGVAEDDASE